MHFRSVISTLLAALLIASGYGCKKSEFRTPPSAPTVLSPDTIASVHWLGKRQLGYEATAYFFMRIWNLSQSAQLERQTLVKLASTPGQWLPGGTNLNAEACSRLWWTLNDLVQQESYLEIRQPTNPPASSFSAGAESRGESVSSLSAGGEGRGEVGRDNTQPILVFAIRLNAAQAEQWRTNLPVVLEPLTGARAVANPEQTGWSLKTAAGFIELSRVGDWTLVAAGPETNPLCDEITARIRRDDVAFVSTGTNLWLEADLAPSRLFPSLSAGGLEVPGKQRKEFAEGEGPQRTERASTSESLGRGEVGLSSSISHFNLSISGDGANVITRARVNFNEPFSIPLPEWRLPMDLLHDPLTSLTVARGLESGLAVWPSWRDLQIGTPPDQLCLWSLAGNPYQVYLAAPLPGSQVAALCDQLMHTGNPWLAANGYISFDHAPDGNGVTWGNLPDIKPFIKFARNDSSGWLYAGLFPDTNTAALPPPAGLIQDILRRTNLVYYDWEVTGPRLQPSLQVAQTTRLITRRPQLSLDSASLTWLGSVIPRLGTSATIINRTGPAELMLLRRSNLGLTSLELHLLTGWLESPQFPR